MKWQRLAPCAPVGRAACDVQACWVDVTEIEQLFGSETFGAA